MRGLPFPTNALFDPDHASEHGTPSRNLDDIPIDPALAAPPAVGPARPTDRNLHPLHQPHPVLVQHQFSPPRQRHYSQEPLKYDQGPQGDPFAPQPPAPYLPIPETGVPRVAKPQRRRRKPRREEECGFCQGNDSKNKHGEPEVMVSCEECGRSGHPSCMELAKVADVVRSYPWRCIECKICEICQEKGDDARILFCDFCDRGWHMDCLQPPLDEEPPGQWHCPLCPLLNMHPLPPDPTQTQHDAFPPEGPNYPTGKPDPDGQGNDPSRANHEMDIRAGDSSTDGSSDSDSDSDETMNASAAPRSVSVKKKRPPKRTTGMQTPRPPKRMRIKVRSPAPPLIVRLRLPPKGKGKEREDDTEHNIFEDLLSPAERDMSKTTIDGFDRTRFEKSRLAAEEKLYPAPAPPPSAAENPDTPIAGPSSRPLRSASLHQLSIPHPLPPASPVPSTPGFVPPTPATFSQTPNTPIVPDGQSTLRIRTIRFGPYDIHPWYDAPFPEEYANIPDGRLWICEFCLKYMRSRFAFGRHRLKCKARHPPGDEIYRDASISIFEVDGRKNKIYCQNLCLLSKMFLDHKSLFYDVEPFLFYVMTEIDDIGAHFVGYFSKEKCSPKQYNVSCIMTLPVRQRQGWGNFLIDFSYLLSKKEQRAGSPEKPLSGLGALGYRNYWTLALMRYLVSAPPKPTLEDISKATSMTIEDIFTVLVQQDMITVDIASTNSARPSPGQSIKFPRGRKNGIARRHLQRPNPQKQMEGGVNKSNVPFVVPTHYEISWDQGKVERWLETWEKKGYLKLKPEKLKWTPFVLSRTKAGVELLQANAGLGFGVPALTGTPQSPTDGGAPMLDIGNRAESLGSGQGSSHEQNEQVVTTRDGGEVTAAHLFDDDLLHEKTATPKKQLSNEPRISSLNSLAMSTQTGPAQAVPDGDSGLQGENSDSLLDGTRNVVRGMEDDTFAVPIKRRRGRPPRVRSPEKAMQAISTESGPMSPRKRRKLGSPSPEDLPASVDLTYSERHGDRVDQAVDHHPLAANGEGHAKNGVHRDSIQHSLDAGLDVGLAEGEKELEENDVLPDDFASRECTDVKSEDPGTPLTGLTSRHSVPSDDTVCVADGINGAAVRSKISGEGEGISQLPGAGGTGDGGSTEDTVALPVVVEEDSDLDAEGEPDDEI